MLAKRILALMAQGGITQVELAKKAELNKVHLNQILTGKKVHITVATLQKIANALNVPISELQGDLPKPEKPEPLNDRTKKAQHFFRAEDVPEDDKVIIEKLIDIHQERAKRGCERGGKNSEEDS